MEIAVYGYGNIGSGVVEIIERNQDRMVAAVGEEVHVKKVLDLRDFEGDPIQPKVVHDVKDIVEDPEISVVCETMGGDEPAFTFTKMALEAGKSVCTSNKVVVANHGAELVEIAKAHNCNYFFEASVGGGIPIIRTITDALQQEHILQISGIVNGTTNFMLTKMDKEGVSFDDVLKEAQDRGYAERNPEADVEGHDACRKIAILSSLVSGETVDFDKLYTEGITKITAEDFAYAKKLGRSIKLLATAKKQANGYFAMTAPFMLSTSHPLYNVNDVFNAVFVKGDMLDDSMYYGRGAGKLPTASAVVADVIQACKFKGTNLPIHWSSKKAELVDMMLSSKRFFARFSKNAFSAEKAEEIFGKVQVINVDSLPDEFAIITPEMTEKAFAEKVAKVDGMITRIRLED